MRCGHVRSGAGGADAAGRPASTRSRHRVSVASAPWGSRGILIPRARAVGEEAVMASKDKAGKNKKQAATRTLKEKRQAKADKKAVKL